MRINVAVPETHVDKPILDAALEGVTRLNEKLIAEGAVPIWDEVVDHVRWKPEPPGQEHFDHAGIVIGRRWGDCDDLAPFHAASLRATGEDPGARAVVRRSGPKRWHAIVQRSDGSVDDPSEEAGMPSPGRRGVVGAWVPPMFERSAGVDGTYIARPQLALRPLGARAGQPEAWQARADLPWHWQPGESPADVAMVSLHASPVSDQAIVGACRGALRLGEASGFVDEDHLDRIEAIADACEGASWEELCEEYGPEHATAAGEVVGSFFGGLKRAFKKVAPSALRTAASFVPGGTQAMRAVTPFLPIAQKVLPFVPGFGGPAAQALQMASPYLQQAFARQAHVPPPQRAPMMPGMMPGMMPPGMMPPGFGFGGGGAMPFG